MNEEWRPIEGYDPVYSISSFGNVWAMRRKGSAGGLLKRSSCVTYPAVNLRRAGSTHLTRVHVLVAVAFIGPAPSELHFVCHRDDDPWNSFVENLYWGTKSDNGRDAVRNGKHFQANKTHCIRQHPFNAVNTRYANGQRFCRRCEQLRAVQRRAA